MKMLKMAQKQDMGISEDKEGFQRLTSKRLKFYFNRDGVNFIHFRQLTIRITVTLSAFPTDASTSPRDLFLRQLKWKLDCLH